MTVLQVVTYSCNSECFLELLVTISYPLWMLLIVLHAWLYIIAIKTITYDTAQM